MAIPTVGFAGAASAAPVKWETVHEEFGPEVEEDACGVPGLTLELSVVVDSRFRIHARGPDALPYFESFVDEINTRTNVATGAYVTIVNTYRFADQKITDNGDGTLTVIGKIPGTACFTTRTARYFLGARASSATRTLWDHCGTPTDPSDDEFLEFVGVLKNVGNDPEVCATLIEAIG